MQNSTIFLVDIRHLSYYSTFMNKRNQSRQTVPLPTEAELEILNILWGTGPATVHDAMTGKETGYTTILKQMQVMTEKGLLVRNERYRSHVYEAGLSKQETQQQLARNLLRRAFDGSAKNLVLGALSSQPVSSSELAEIRKILDKFEKGAK
jgi:BlaI family penicillinase repressor